MSSIRPFREIKRRKTKKIKVGNVYVGGDAPISVQSMTNTLTTDAKATILQINQIAEAGADIVRVSCPDEESTKALKEIVKHANVPIVADIHFHYKRAIEAAEAGASCLRINPGNIGSKDRVKEIVKAAKDFNCSIRIGVNGGSIEQDLLEKYKEPCPEALVESADRNIKILEDLDFFNFKISVKASDIFLAVNAYRQLSKEILKSLNLKNRGVKIISCPSCARQAFEVIKTVEILEQRLSHIKEPLTLSIIGCVVNGPGEASQTDIGLTGGGKGNNMIYLSGLQDHKVPSEKIIEHIVGLVEKKAEQIRNQAL